MAWKLRKDKLKAGAPEAEAVTAPEPTTMPPAEEAEHAPVFDLSGSAFQTDSAVTPDDEPEVPSFLDHEPFMPPTDGKAHVELPPIELEPLPIDLQPLPTSPAPAAEPFFLPEASFLPDPLPEFDPVVAQNAEIEPEAIAVAPLTPAPEVGDASHVAATFEPITEAHPSIDLEREAVAPGLVTMEGGLPKVAPFILDTPAAPPVADTPRMHSVTIRLGKLSATHFLTKDVTTIGRPDSLVQNYPDIEIELDDGISRRHAEIRHTGLDYAIVDVGSTNGTLLNGERLTPNAAVTLQSGDRIRVGELTELLFE